MVSLLGVNPPEANPPEANLLEANLPEANLPEANFRGANLREAKCAQETRQARLTLREKECKEWYRIDRHHPRI